MDKSKALVFPTVSQSDKFQSDFNSTQSSSLVSQTLQISADIPALFLRIKAPWVATQTCRYKLPFSLLLCFLENKELFFCDLIINSQKLEAQISYKENVLYVYSGRRFSPLIKDTKRAMRLIKS